MTIDEFREQIAISLGAKCDEQWFNILDDSEPGHYGVEDLDFQVATESIWVDIPKKSFTFEAGTLSFSARLGSSKAEDGVDKKFRKVVSGAGMFDFGGSREIKVIEFKIKEKIDLF